MSIFKEYKKSKLKYKGQIFIIIEADMKGSLPGLRGKRNSINRILLNAKLPKRDKQLELHRLLTGRGLRDTKNGKPVKYV